MQKFEPSHEPEEVYRPIHVMPAVDVILHVESHHCDCQPKLQRQPSGRDLWLHRFIHEDFH